MNVLFWDWNCYGRKDVLDAFSHLGYHCTTTPLSDTADMLGSDRATVEKMIDIIKKGDYDFTFSMNYFPMVSFACEECQIPYFSWIYDNPCDKAYGPSIVNSCNYIFTFDSYMYDALSSQGVSTVYYAPLAANVTRMSAPASCPAHDISFVGALYNEDHNFYEEFRANTAGTKDEYWLGYVDALIEAQKNVYGTNLCTTAIPPELAATSYVSINEWSEQTCLFTTPEQIFYENVICRKITQRERLALLEKLSARQKVALYTRNADAVVGKCKNYGYADYKTMCPAIFQNSKINLNITVRSIQHGIPLRAMEIMGAGGFLLTNYQADFLLHFEPDVDFVYYENIDDAVAKAEYYLSHDSERQKIARNGYEKICEHHTYEKRISDMAALLS